MTLGLEIDALDPSDSSPLLTQRFESVSVMHMIRWVSVIAVQPIVRSPDDQGLLFGDAVLLQNLLPSEYTILVIFVSVLIDGKHFSTSDADVGIGVSGPPLLD